MISWTHLKKHGYTTKEYKKQYGETVSENYRELKKKQNQGKNNPNYGNKMPEKSKKSISQANYGKEPPNKNQNISQNQKNKISRKAKERNKQWHKNGTHPLVGRKHNQNSIEKIKKKRSNQKITTEQALKAIDTKRRNGHDLAFFRGNKHSRETKEKISKKSKETNQKKKNQSIEKSRKRLFQNGYTLLEAKDQIIKIQCHHCDAIFSRTRQYATPNKIDPKMCPCCYLPNAGYSQGEVDLANFLKRYEKVMQNDRSVIPPKELDVLLPDKKIAFEFNGLYWHSEIYKTPEYHFNKKKLTEKQNIELIQIFEDEWFNKKEIVQSKILSLIGKIPRKIFARNCNIKEISSKLANQFLKENHLQSSGRSNIRIGLFYNNELISVMTFLKNDISKNIKGWELNRFCHKKYVSVTGGASKMFQYFVKNYQPEIITTFSDQRWAKADTVYSKLGFSFVYETKPNYWYFMPNDTKRYHRYALKKPENTDLTEKELRESQGYIRIHDCGSVKWAWSRNH